MVRLAKVAFGSLLWPVLADVPAGYIVRSANVVAFGSLLWPVLADVPVPFFGPAPPGTAPKSGCKDLIQDCAALGRQLFDIAGRCHYPAAELCMRTCGLCFRVRAAQRCAVLQVDAGRFQAQRIDWAQFLGAAVERVRMISTASPVLAEFPGFFSADEAEALADVGFAAGFQQEDDLPPSDRDVKKIDCEHRICLLNPLVQEVYRRVSDLLGIPPWNFESMEFLLYREGQHYQSHMDDADWGEMPALSAGLRVLTVLFVFAEATEGGETRFTEANLAVKPAAGTAIIWANVASNIWEVDPFSMHRAMPVLSGTKIAANFWVHPFEYRAAERYYSL